MEQPGEIPCPAPRSLETLFVHGGEHQRSANAQGTPTVQPIYTTTTYLYADMAALEKAGGGETSGYVYAQSGNPNVAALERTLAEIEGGTGALVCGSGMAAIHLALLATGIGPGKKLLASQALYGPSLELLQTSFAAHQVEIVLRDLCQPDIEQVIYEERPDVIYLEALSNPLVQMADLLALSTAARAVGAVTLIDSTFATPYLLRPLALDFDIVVHSATKYLSGHGDSSAGVLISARKQFLERARYHAMLVGTALSPFDAYLVLRGLRTLPLRMKQQCQSALQVAYFLARHPAIARVHYPGLPFHSQHSLASGLLEREQYGGVLAFELKEQSKAAVFRFIDRLRLCLPATTLGDIFTEVSYPVMSSHCGLSAAQRARLGITDGCVRLSVGIEGVEDILQDLEQALAE
jgi:cystathionine beta-lyase/cystathionine gamma-synthase